MLKTYLVPKNRKKVCGPTKRFFLLAFSLLCFGISNLMAQNITVSGVVTDEIGEEMVGVTIHVEGTTRGTTTNLEGEYNISVAPKSTLIFTFIGYTTQKIVITDQTKLDVQMSVLSMMMDEFVVVGYGTQSRRTVTSAITKIGGEEVQGAPINTVGEALKGKIAGTRVYSNNNTPGADPIIRIRGGSSINMSNEPLILVDGVERAFSGINANDIESIETLKDAASTAVYGARGSNGVVLITTKSGTKNKAPRVTFEANVAFQQAERKFDLLGAEDYIRMVRPSIAEGKTPMNNFTSGFSASSINDANSVYSTRWLGEGETVPAGYKKMRDPLDNTKWLIFQDNDFQDILFRDNYWQNYYIGVDGGTDKTTYAASMGYTTDDGVALGTEFNRLTARLNLNTEITKKLKLTGMMEFSDAKSKEFSNQMNVISRGISAAPTMKRYMDDGTPSYGYNGTSLNPEYNDYIFDNDNRNKRISVVGGLEYKILEGLKANVNVSMYNHVNRWGSFRKRGYFSNATPTTENFNELTRTKLDAFLNYTKSLKKDHNFSLMGGYSYSRDDRNAFGASAEGGGSDKTPTLTAQPDRTASTSSFEKVVLLSYFGRLNYDYKKKYLLTATFRADGSSKFVKGNQWGFFPAMSVGWMASEESFMRPIKQINDLKLRMSFGETGNNAIGLNDAVGRYGTNVYSGQPGLYPTVMPNEYLEWETTRQFDLGFDLTMFNERLTVNADYFNRLTRNLLFDKELPNTTGYSSVKTNVGEVKFYGFDIEIASRNIVGKNFSWDSKFTWSYVKNKVVKLPYNGRDKNRIGGITTLGDGNAFGGTAEGESLYGLYGMKVDYVIRTEDQLANAMYDDYSAGYNPADGTTVKGRKNMGDYEWVNREGSSKRVVNGVEYDQINSEDRFLLGYSVPHTTGGLSNTFTYKNLSLNVFVDWALGHTIMHAQMARQFINTFTGNTALNAEVLNTWSPENPDAKYARFYSGGESVSSNFKNNADIFAFKGDYLCIREISLGYKLPATLISRLSMKEAMVTVSANNLHYFTAVPGISPEVGTSSTNDAGYYNYPPIRRISLGVKVTF